MFANGIGEFCSEKCAIGLFHERGLMFEAESVFVGGCGCRRGPSGVGEIF